MIKLQDIVCYDPDKGVSRWERVFLAVFSVPGG